MDRSGLYVLEDGQLTCSSRTAKTWKTCQLPTYVLTDLLQSSIVLDHPVGNFEQDETEEVEEENGEYVWIMSGDFMY